LNRETKGGSLSLALVRTVAIAGQDVLRARGERDGRSVPFALDRPEPQAGRDIPDIDGDNF